MPNTSNTSSYTVHAPGLNDEQVTELKIIVDKLNKQSMFIVEHVWVPLTPGACYGDEVVDRCCIFVRPDILNLKNSTEEDYRRISKIEEEAYLLIKEDIDNSKHFDMLGFL